MRDDLARRGWHNARQLDAHRYAADSEPTDPGYSIVVGGAYRVITRHDAGTHEPYSTPAIGPIPTPEEAAGIHEAARVSQGVQR